MRPRIALVSLMLMAVAATCVRLGFWQLSRFEQKKAIVAAQRAALAAPPLPWDEAALHPDRLVGRRVVLRGRYDAAHHVLLAYRERDGTPGVELVTPLVLGSGERVLVNRGWLEADDGMRASPRDFDEPGTHEVVGVAETLGHAHFGTFVLEADSVVVLSARGLDRDTMSARLPGRLAPWWVRQLPGPGVPDRPRRSAPPALDPGMHLSYAVQWFAIAAVVLAGGAAFVRAQLRRRPAA